MLLEKLMPNVLNQIKMRVSSKKVPQRRRRRRTETKILTHNPYNFITIDCEGLCGADNVCELAMHKYINGIVTETRMYRFKPYMFNGEVNNLDWLEKYNTLPSIVDSWDDICRFMKGSLIISHNFHGDLCFFKRDIKHFNLKNPNIYGICSEQLSKVVFPKKHKKSGQLRKLCSLLGIPLADSKSSSSDADLTARLYLMCIGKVSSKNIKDLLKQTGNPLYCSNDRSYYFTRKRK